MNVSPPLVADPKHGQSALPSQRPSVAARNDGPRSRQPLFRVEDTRLVTGRGAFTADYVTAETVQAVVLRSPFACGRLTSIDTQTARTLPGVLDILTGEDVRQEGLGGIPWEVCPPGMEARARFPGDPEISEPQPLLAIDRIRYVGEPIAFIVAETLEAALDAAEAIAIEVDEEDAIADVRAAAASREPFFRSTLGNRQATDEAFARADLVVELTTHIPRLVAAPIETRGYVASFDATINDWSVVASAGKPHPVRNTIAHFVFHAEETAFRVIAPDIGGGFGSKNVAHAEMALTLWAARRLHRSVSWSSTRNEAFLSDMQGRDHAITARLALDAAGRMLALDYRSDINLGAYLAPRGVIPCLSGLKVLTGPYGIAAAYAQIATYFTNTVPTCPYRGAGVPETAFMVERLIDIGARRLGLDPVELRRRNLVSPSALPWSTPIGTTLHSVDFPAVMDRLLAATPPLEAPSKAGRRRGRGMAFTIEGYGTSFDEAAELIVSSDGRLEARIGTKSGGQSHETTYAQIIADIFDVELDLVTIVQNDTSLIRRGNGTGASRSLTTGGSALQIAARHAFDLLREDAGRQLGCAADELAYAAGEFIAADSRRIGLSTLVAALPDGRLHVTDMFRPIAFSFPGGCHLAEVEVDIETGAVKVTRYLAVHDAGNVVNDQVVAGQLHGGITQGIGAALVEVMAYDPDTAQALTASFADYALPRADDVPGFDIMLHGTPCASNPLGAKAVGEAGTVAAPAAVINAIVDALSDLGIEHVEMPATPARIWQALTEARLDAGSRHSHDRPAEKDDE